MVFRNIGLQKSPSGGRVSISGPRSMHAWYQHWCKLLCKSKLHHLRTSNYLYQVNCFLFERQFSRYNIASEVYSFLHTIKNKIIKRKSSGKRLITVITEYCSSAAHLNASWKIYITLYKVTNVNKSDLCLMGLTLCNAHASLSPTRLTCHARTGNVRLPVHPLRVDFQCMIMSPLCTSLLAHDR